MIVRSPRRENNWTVLANVTLRDPGLSFRARGVLAFMLSMPDNYRFNADDISRHGTEGRGAILTALRELEKHGYILRRRTQNEQGKWSTEMVVYDESQHLDYYH